MAIMGRQRTPQRHLPTRTLYAKFCAPDASRLSARPRLHHLLDAGIGGTLWVTAPAGAGKTSLLACWAQQLPRPPLWYRVDPADDDPAAFFEWFARLAGQAAPAPELPAPAPEHLLNLPHFARRFFRACFASLPDDSVVLLDNLHDAPALAACLCAMVQERRPGMTLVFSSRSEPEGELLALQADPSHRLLRWSQLRCTDDEAAALAADWQLPPPTAEQLARAGGWMAALAVLLRRAEADSPGAWQAGPDAALFQLFAHRAFDALSPAQQQLLLVNAEVPWIDAASTDRLCGTQDAAALLEQLWRAQFFIERRQGPTQAWQYLCHPLLGAFLQERSARLWPAARRRHLGLQQARAFEALGDPDAALHMYLRVDTVPARARAAQLLLQQAPALMAAGKVATLMGWLQRLPGEGTDAAPSLAYWQGLCLAMAAPSQAIAVLARAHAGHVAQGNTLAALLDVCAIIDAYFVQWEDWRAARPWADELARLHALQVEQGGGLPSLDLEVRMLSSGLNLMFPCFDHPLVARWRDRAEALLHSTPEAGHQVMLAGFVIAHAWWAGEPMKIRAASRVAASALARSTPRPLAAFQLHMWIGIGAYSDGEAADPEMPGHLDQVLALGEAQGTHLFDFHAWCHKVMEAMARDDAAAGAHALQQARRSNPGAQGTQQLLALCEMAQALVERRWQVAVDLGRQSLLATPDFGGWDYGRQTLCLGLAQALVMLGEPDQARALMDGPMDFARRLPSPYFDLMAHCVLAACAQQTGDIARADDGLRYALGIARSQGFRHLHPWWSPPFFAPLLARALQAGIEPAWVARLIGRQRVGAPDADLPHWPYPVRLQTLGSFAIALDGQLPAGQGKAQRRVLDLLKVLAAHGGRDVAATVVADALWPDSEGDAGMGALDVTLHRARKLLGHPDALRLQDGRLSLSPELVWLDLWALQRLARQVDDGLGGPTATPATLAAWAGTLTECLRGPLLAGEADTAWLLAARERWHRRVEQLALRLGTACLAAGLAVEAQRLYERLLEVEPGSAALTQALRRAREAPHP